SNNRTRCIFQSTTTQSYYLSSIFSIRMGMAFFRLKNTKRWRTALILFSLGTTIQKTETTGTTAKIYGKRLAMIHKSVYLSTKTGFILVDFRAVLKWLLTWLCSIMK